MVTELVVRRSYGKMMTTKQTEAVKMRLSTRR